MQEDARDCDIDGETRVRVRARVEDERNLRVIYNQFSHRYRVSLGVRCSMVCNFQICAFTYKDLNKLLRYKEISERFDLPGSNGDEDQCLYNSPPQNIAVGFFTCLPKFFFTLLKKKGKA